MEVAPILRNWAKAFDGLAAQLSASRSSRDPASNEQPLESTERPNPQEVTQEAQEENQLRKRVLQSHASALRLLSERIFKSQYKPVDAIQILTEVWPSRTDPYTDPYMGPFHADALSWYEDALTLTFTLRWRFSTKHSHGMKMPRPQNYYPQPYISLVTPAL